MFDVDNTILCLYSLHCALNLQDLFICQLQVCTLKHNLSCSCTPILPMVTTILLSVLMSLTFFILYINNIIQYLFLSNLTHLGKCLPVCVYMCLCVCVCACARTYQYLVGGGLWRGVMRKQWKGCQKNSFSRDSQKENINKQ